MQDNSPILQQSAQAMEEEARRQRMKTFCKKAVKFCCSQIGLCLLVVGYAVAGGFIFMHLEQTNEKQECIQAMEKYIPLENGTVYKLWDIAASFRTDDEMEYALIEFQKQLIKFREDVLSLGYSGVNCTLMGEEGGPAYQWNFLGAMLFSTTVFTTVGYGNIAPKTFWGRLVCIAYAVLGIPLMLLCLANIGEVMADIFRYVYITVCCCGCFRRREKRQPQPNPVRPNQADSAEVWKNQYDAKKGASSATVIDDDEEDEDEEEAKISVPLTVTISLIGGYLFMGSLLFGVWEEWDWLKAAYYCFVTIATIGFGDVVPGSANFESSEAQFKMMGAAVYMLFGMAIMSMAFNLIQEEIVSKFRWLATKLGIIKKEENEEDDADKEDSPETKKPAGQGQKREAAAGVPPYGAAGPFPQQPGAKQPATYDASKSQPSYIPPSKVPPPISNPTKPLEPAAPKTNFGPVNVPPKQPQPKKFP